MIWRQLLPRASLVISPIVESGANMEPHWQARTTPSRRNSRTSEQVLLQLVRRSSLCELRSPITLKVALVAPSSHTQRTAVFEPYLYFHAVWSILKAAAALAGSTSVLLSAAVTHKSTQRLDEVDRGTRCGPAPLARALVVSSSTDGRNTEGHSSGSHHVAVDWDNG